MSDKSLHGKVRPLVVASLSCCFTEGRDSDESCCRPFYPEVAVFTTIEKAVWCSGGGCGVVCC